MTANSGNALKRIKAEFARGRLWYVGQDIFSGVETTHEVFSNVHAFSNPATQLICSASDQWGQRFHNRSVSAT